MPPGGAGLHGAMRRGARVLLLCAALAACGDLPQPFQPTEKSTPPWTGPGPGTWGSIQVPPIDGMPAPHAAALAETIVEALHALDVPAGTRAASRGSIALVGRIAAFDDSLRWALVAPDGETVLRFDAPRPGASWRDATASDLAAIAAQAAGRVAAALETPRAAAVVSTLAPVAVPVTVPVAAPVVVEAVRGAPGDGGPALTRAMRQSLARIGIALADAPDGETLTVLGRVSVAPVSDASGGDAVAIAWTVLRPDGTRIGTVTQSNRVPAERLAGTWGRLAEAVAGAGAPGIAQLLQLAAVPETREERAAPIAVAAVVQAVRRAAPRAAPIAVAAIVQAVRRAAPHVAPIAVSTAVQAVRRAAPHEAPIAVSVTVR